MNVCLGGHLFALSKKFFEKLNSSTAHKLVLLSYSRLRIIKERYALIRAYLGDIL